MTRKGFLQTHASWVSLAARLLDQIAILSASVLAFYLARHSLDMPPVYGLSMIAVLLLAMLVFPWFHLYETWRGASLTAEVRALVGAWLVTLTAMVTIGAITKTTEIFSRLWFGYWMVLGLIALVALRLMLRYGLRTARARGMNQRTMVIVGCGELAERVANRVLQAPWTGFRLMGFFTPDSDCLLKLVEERPILGDLNALPAYVEAEGVDQVWIAVPLERHEEVQEALYNLRHSTADIRMVPDIFSYNLLNHSISDVAGIPVLNLSSSPMEGLNRLIKAIEDRVIAAIILFLIWPLLAAIAIGVKLTSPGPVIFKQRRHGWAGEEVEIWKFRSMVVHDEHGRVTQASRQDPRITRFGAFLRRTSLDELPQFINVLQGRMSIVGPRPHAIYHTEQYKEQVVNYMLRHKVKPGITGWAQINGYRGETDTLDKMAKRIEYDLYYIENWSLWFDIKIILMTVFKGFSHRNAY